MTHTETTLAELSESIRRALADWDGCFVNPHSHDAIAAIVAGERMAGVLCRVRVLADYVIQHQEKARENHEQV